MFNLSKRDADVAIRPASDPPQTLVGRRIATVAFAIYGDERIAARRSTIADLGTARWVAPDDSLSATSVAHWMRSELPESDIALCADSLVAMGEAARAGIGLAALPCYFGDTLPGLVRVHPPIKAMETALWILTHEDLKHTARIRAFTEFAAMALGKRRALLEGQGIQASKREATGS
jgi:DNA-binding transcriptional LysR family regulator